MISQDVISILSALVEDVLNKSSLGPQEFWFFSGLVEAYAFEEPLLGV